MCGPQRGDLGEMMCATYLLFVGNELRKKKDKNLSTFSIHVDQWVETLVQIESAKMETGAEAMETEGRHDMLHGQLYPILQEPFAIWLERCLPTGVS
jgi:hypothetical protein